MRRFLPLFLTVAGCLCAQDLKLSSKTLGNGLKVIVHEDHDVPSVALYLFFRIGSRNESPGTTGLAHFFEHMMFNGAKRYGPKQFDREMEDAGGNNNAYTSRDLTVYTDWFPTSALPLMMDMESDRMVGLLFDPKIITSERGVVYSERRLRIDNSNFGALIESTYATAFLAHPYQWPVVGWASDIEGWTMEDLQHHYKVGYAPNNCTMVIVGDVDTAGTLALVEKWFGSLPRQEPPPPVRTKEPPQNGERRVEVRRPAQLPLLMQVYHVGDSRDKDDVVIDVLENIMSRGESSRLTQRLVQKDQLVSSINFGHDPSLDPGTILINAQPRSGVAVDKVEAVIEEEIARVQNDLVTAEELQKAKNQITAGFYRELKTIAGKANLIGTSEVYYGDANTLSTYVSRVNAVTAEDVKRVAGRYLQKTNRTTGVLVPTAATKKETSR